MGRASVVARPPIPAEAFEKYPNQWIALRDGTIVAVADTYDELVAHPAVRPQDDMLYHVRSSSTYFY
jgi:hypothetical protein